MPTQEQFDAMNDAAFEAFWNAHVEAAEPGQRAAASRARKAAWDFRWASDIARAELSA